MMVVPPFTWKNFKREKRVAKEARNEKTSLRKKKTKKDTESKIIKTNEKKV